MDYSIESLKKIMESNNGIASAKQLADKGVSRLVLYQYLINGLIAKESHGNYVIADNQPDEYRTIQNRSPKMIYSHGA